MRFDLAQNVAGIVTVAASSAGAHAVTVKLGEHLDPDGHVIASDGAVPGGLQSSRITGLGGTPVSLDLSYAGLRFAEVSGSREPIRVDVERISAAPPRVGRFESSDARLNAIGDAAVLTFENCLQGTPVDTPLYEKQGYTGDAQLLAESYAYTFWMPNSLGSWLRASVLPSQAEDGSIPGIAPSPPGDWIFDTPSPAWDAALFELPATLLRHYDDRLTLRHALPVMRRYLDFLDRRFPDGIIDVGLGDWNPPGHIMPPEPPGIISTAYHHRFLMLTSGFLEMLGDAAAARSLRERAERVRIAFNARFLRPDGWYAHPDFDAYRETDNVVALAFGLAPTRTRAAVMKRILTELDARGGHLDTGIIGTKFLLRTLARSSRPETAYEVARNSGYPGWQHWLANGATTLYENWELDGRSHNHAMFGTIQEWLFADVAGIAPATPGWDALKIAPRLPPGERFECAATLETLAGEVSVEWTSDGRSARGRVVASPNVRLRGAEAFGPVTARARRDGSVEYAVSARAGR
ncbi:MAG: family 78 glycoside hydrolase catalytic domain [Nocardiaceae bacterium]|nr:family 78 glycoside hydrolase catalytic domain [Nocardiaceae bacterium]